jgi:hypothetical protein
MTPIHGYAASIEAAKQTLEEAKNVLARDVGTAIANARFCGTGSMWLRSSTTSRRSPKKVSL